MKIIIGADVVPTESSLAAFSAGDIASVIDQAVSRQLASADLRIFNLETPLADTASPIAKNGPHLITPTSAVRGYKALGADVVTLANNHILDQGEQGLDSTVKALENEGIAYLGVGATAEEASRPLIIEREGKKIGIYACAEHEFSVVGDGTKGANPFDPLECPDRVKALKEKCDHVIVLYHGGREQYRYPLPELQRNCRKLAEKGADLVICQHTHCVGCAERYGGGTVIYGQGNFIFDRLSNEYWDSGMLVSVELDDTAEISYIPLVKRNGRVYAAAGEEAERIMDGFNERSAQITDPGFVRERLEREAEKNALRLARVLSGDRTWDKVMYKAAPKLLKKRLLRKDRRLKIYNMVACESHREILLTALKK